MAMWLSCKPAEGGGSGLDDAVLAVSTLVTI
jgi:hypothetical protein